MSVTRPQAAVDAGQLAILAEKIAAVPDKLAAVHLDLRYICNGDTSAIPAGAKQAIAEYKLDSICSLLFSWVHPLAPEQQDKSLKQVPSGQTPISRQELVERIIADALPVRFQVQLHKVIWAPEKRGV